MRLVFFAPFVAVLAAVGCSAAECDDACRRADEDCHVGSKFVDDCELACRQRAQGPCISEFGAYTHCLATAPDKTDCTSFEPPSCAAKFDTYSQCLVDAN